MFSNILEYSGKRLGQNPESRILMLRRDVRA
jgi:hypothetical protein